MAQKYARIFVRGHYLFQDANSFLIAKLYRKTVSIGVRASSDLGGGGGWVGRWPSCPKKLRSARMPQKKKKKKCIHNPRILLICFNSRSRFLEPCVQSSRSVVNTVAEQKNKGMVISSVALFKRFCNFVHTVNVKNDSIAIAGRARHK